MGKLPRKIGSRVGSLELLVLAQSGHGRGQPKPDTRSLSPWVATGFHLWERQEVHTAIFSGTLLMNGVKRGTF